MTNSVEVDEVLKKLASQSIKRGENVRATVRDLTESPRLFRRAPGLSQAAMGS